ncbi:MAG TPA: 3-hydroxyacyl-CoA dehydrogenase NAD-binding domain-containing protein [Egibacteraceae bacterium]|nr:3-hydroxyacyl-CoA dehydrogenase NAD-binding domain-containing protein [Egibacteraceae bacterium]
MRIAVVGAGTMGAGIAYAAAVGGIEVALYDADPAGLERGLARARADLDGAVARGKVEPAQADAAAARLRPARSLAAAVDRVDAVIEAIAEDMDAKQALFRQVDALAPGALLATNTSALSVTQIMAVLEDPGRGLGMHFFNPVRAMRLCELVLGVQTRPDSVERAEALARAMGKETVRVADVAGFATSRINAVIGNEAFFMLSEGVATAEDIDTAVRLGLNHPMGPLEMADLVGLDVRLAVLGELRRSLGEKYRPAPLMEKLVRAGRLGRKTGQGVYRYDAEGRREPGSAEGLR